MERLIIYLHRNVNNSKFIKKKFPPEIRPAPPLNGCEYCACPKW